MKNVRVIIPYDAERAVPRAYTLDWDTARAYLVNDWLWVVKGRFTNEKPPVETNKEPIARLVDLPTASQPALGFELV